jgi:hypothetical protein
VPPTGSAQPAARPAATAAARRSDERAPASRPGQTSSESDGGPASAPEPQEDDEAWLARQVAASLQTNPPVRTGGANSSEDTTGWDDAKWEDEGRDRGIKRTNSAGGQAPIAAAGSVPSLLDEMEALAASPAAAPSSAPTSAVAGPSVSTTSIKPQAVESPDDFFAAFGVK